jgi:hypothetical protein
MSPIASSTKVKRGLSTLPYIYLALDTPSSLSAISVKAEVDVLHKKVMSKMIAWCGYCGKTKWQIIYGPASLTGTCFCHPYGEQGTGQILFFLKYWQSHGHARDLARITLSWEQFQAGIKLPILTYTNTPLPHLETCWLSALRTFLDCCNGRIKVDNPFVLPTQQEHDFLHYGRYLRIQSVHT